MQALRKVLVLAGLLALCAAPALALPSQAPSNQGTSHAPTTPAGPPSDVPPDNQGTANADSTPGPHASLPEKAKAYGFYCQDQSKKHTEGQTGTAFSRCVTAMAKLATGQTSSPRRACHTESRHHKKGEKGTPFTRCVKAGAKLLGQHS